jgi:hypothetical protein
MATSSMRPRKVSPPLIRLPIKMVVVLAAMTGSTSAVTSSVPSR